MEYGTRVKVTLADGITRNATIIDDVTTGILVCVEYDDGTTAIVARKRIVVL
jgi:hypothetical protein